MLLHNLVNKKLGKIIISKYRDLKFMVINFDLAVSCSKGTSRAYGNTYTNVVLRSSFQNVLFIYLISSVLFRKPTMSG